MSLAPNVCILEMNENAVDGTTDGDMLAYARSVATDEGMGIAIVLPSKYSSRLVCLEPTPYCSCQTMTHQGVQCRHIIKMAIYFQQPVPDACFKPH